MTEWDTRVESHDALRLLTQIDQAASNTGRRLRADTRETLDRIKAVSGFIRSVIDETDPQLVAPAMLDGLTGPLGQVASYLETFRTSGDIPALVATNGYLDGALQVIGWRGLASSRDAQAVRESVTAMRRSAGQLLRSLTEDVDEAKRETAGLRTEIGQRRARLKEATGEVKDELTAQLKPLQAGVAALQATIESQKTRLDTAIAAFQEQFSSAEAKRAERAAASDAKRVDVAQAASEKIQQQHADFMRKVTKAANDSQSKTQAAADAALQRLAEDEAKARRLVSKTGSEAVSGGYVTYADSQAKAADLWRFIGVGLVALVAAYGFVSVGVTGVMDFDMHWLAGRLLVAVPVVGLALYAFAQSSKHRAREREARQYELDLAALDPYIELLPDDQRNTLKGELAGRAFFRQTPPPATESDANVIGELLAILKEAIKRS